MIAPGTPCPLAFRRIYRHKGSAHSRKGAWRLSSVYKYNMYNAIYYGAM